MFEDELQLTLKNNPFASELNRFSGKNKSPTSEGFKYGFILYTLSLSGVEAPIVPLGKPLLNRIIRIIKTKITQNSQ